MEIQVSLMFFVVCGAYVIGGKASPQYYPLPYPGQPFQGNQDPYYNNPSPWQPNARHNFTQPNPNPNPNPNPYYYPSPNPQSYPDPLSAEDIHRQAYGVPQPSASGYPQIYKIDNLIIIANPPQQQPQPCIPQPRPPPQFPNPKPPTGSEGDQRDEILNRIPGDEPSKCTWAIVACCSPDNVQVRYNCFELLGCPGFFFDNSPCEPKIVMAAANAALEFYRSAGNSTTGTSSGSSDTISNRL